jgi:hypothetical protein
MTTCAKCGTENVAGDAFCGNCGAFLEFAAEEAADETPAAEETAAETTPAETTAGPAPAAPVPPAEATPAPPTGPTCSACGRANPAERRFCISCGERLPAAPPAVAPDRAPGSPPVPGSPAMPGSPADHGRGAASQPPAGAGPVTPAWEFPVAPVPAATAVASPAAPVPTAASSGGGSRLPLIGGALVILALLGGGAFLVLGGGLGGGTTGSAASAPPSGGGASESPGGEPSAEPSAPAETPAPETPAASEAPSVPPEPTTPAATIPPGPSVGIAITAAKASSQLAANRAPKYLYDGSPVTAWKSKTGKLDASWVEISFAAAAVTKIQVWAGWQKDKPLFYGNHRPRNVTVAFDGGVPVPLEFKDALGAQGVAIPPELGIVGATRLRITIIDTYPSRKTSAGGSPSKEVAISEIRVYGVPVTP